MADDFVSHRRQDELIVACSPADHRLLVAGGSQLLGKLQRHRPDHEREDRVCILLDGRDVRSEILSAKRRPDFLDDLAAAILERLLETTDDLVAEGIVRADGDNLLVALVAGPLPERMAGLGACSTGSDEIWK